MTCCSESLSFASRFWIGQQLLLPRFQFDLRAQLVDGRRNARGMLIARAFVQRLSGRDFGARRFDARGVGDDRQVGVRHGLHHQVARILQD